MDISLCVKLLERAFYSILALRNSLYTLKNTVRISQAGRNAKGSRIQTDCEWMIRLTLFSLFHTYSQLSGDSLSSSVLNHHFPSHNSRFVFCMVAQFREEAWGKSLASLFHRIRTLILQGGESWGVEQAAWDRNEGKSL